MLGDEQISDSDKCIDSLTDCMDAPELTMTVAMAISDEIPVQTFSSLGNYKYYGCKYGCNKLY